MKNRVFGNIILVLLVIHFFPAAAEAAPAADIRSLIVLGIEENLGLKIEQLNLPTSRNDEVFEAAAFDSELFSLVKVSETSSPFASSFSSSDSDDSRLLSAQLGLGKRYSLGTTASLVLSTERATGNDIFNDLSPSYRTALLLDLTQPLLRDAGSQVNSTGLDLARNRTRQAQLSYLLQAQSLAQGIADLAFQVAAADQVVSLRQDAVRLAHQTYDANQKRFTVGVIPISEVQQAETALADRELRLSLARQNRELLFEELNRQLNRRLPTNLGSLDVRVDDGNAAPVLANVEELFLQAKQQRLDLQISAVDLQSAAVQKDFYQNQLQPRLDLQFQAGLNGLSGEQRDPASASRYQGSWFDSTGSMLQADGYQWAVGLQYRVPLGNRQAEARWRQAQLQEQRSKYRQRDLEAQLHSDLAQQLTSLNRSGEQLEIARKFESLAELSLQQEQRRLEEGLSDTFRILSFQDKMIDAKIGRIDAAAQVRRNLVRLDYVRGDILESYQISVKIDTEGLTNEDI